MKLRFALITSALLLAAAAPLPVAAQTIASKVESMGEARYVQVSGLMAKDRNGFLALQAEVANSGIDAHRIFWRIKWLDESGFQVWDDEPWKPALIQGSARQNLQAVAPTPKAKDFRLQINAEENGAPLPDPTSRF